MPSGVEHHRTYNVCVAAVPTLDDAVMPSGVEHTLREPFMLHRWGLDDALMPSGVEHNWYCALLCASASLDDALMPSGVEPCANTTPLAYTPPPPAMPEPLKHFFNRPLVERIADSIAAVHPPFDRRAFVARASDGLDALELKGRAQHIADALSAHLPADFADAAPVILASLGPKHRTDELEGAGMAPFFYLPHTMFVAARGLDHFELSMNLQHALTQRFSCEFSIRPFLDRHPEQTLARLAQWSLDPDAHVRRLVSEGTRPLLPWAPRVRLLDEHPERALSLIEALRDDPSTMVRRSVANHLNDVSKLHPELVYALCERWLRDATDERRKLVEHALRSAVKRADKRALALLGHGAKPKVTVDEVQFTPQRVRIGDSVRVSLTVTSAARRAQSLNLDLAVDFVKLRGSSTKVFKLRRVELAPGASIDLEKSVSLAVHTTRTPRVGPHAVALLVNGTRVELGSFTVLEAKRPRASR